jgi:hypothetical protein
MNSSFAALFPIFFVGLWIVVVYVLSWFGWRWLARWQTREEPTGRSFPWSSAAIGLVNFNNCLNLRVSQRGLWMKPVFVFSLFHPALFIPWSDVRSVRRQSYFFVFSIVVVRLNDSEITLSFWSSVSTEILNTWSLAQPRE